MPSWFREWGASEEFINGHTADGRSCFSRNTSSRTSFYSICANTSASSARPYIYYLLHLSFGQNIHGIAVFLQQLYISVFFLLELYSAVFIVCLNINEQNIIKCKLASGKSVLLLCSQTPGLKQDCGGRQAYKRLPQAKQKQHKRARNTCTANHTHCLIWVFVRFPEILSRSYNTLLGFQ